MYALAVGALPPQEAQQHLLTHLRRVDLGADGDERGGVARPDVGVAAAGLREGYIKARERRFGDRADGSGGPQ